MRLIAPMAGIGCFAIGLVLSSANQTPAATSFVEDFSDNSPGPNMVLGPAFGGATTDFTGAFTVTSGTDARIYLATNDTDYATDDFVFEATAFVPDIASGWSIAFFGMGNPTPNPDFFGEPFVPHVFVGVRPDDDAWVGRNTPLGSQDYGVGNQEPTDPPGDGEHRLRMTWNATTMEASFALDLFYDGTFGIDYSMNFDASANGFDATNSLLFVGGGNGVRFDDINVTVGPIAPAVPGDFDGDGDVDGADFVVWQTNFPTATDATLADGDADSDGDVDGADFVIWQTNFPFTPSGSGVASVPEPNTLILASVGISGLITVMGRRRKR